MSTLYLGWDSDDTLLTKDELPVLFKDKEEAYENGAARIQETVVFNSNQNSVLTFCPFCKRSIVLLNNQKMIRHAPSTKAFSGVCKGSGLTRKETLEKQS